MAVFQNGVKDLAVNNAMNNATKQVQELNAQALDEKEKLAQQTALANQLAMQLTGFGADAATVEQATKFAPSTSAQYQAEQNAELQASSQQFQGEQADLDRKNRYAIAALALGKEDKLAEKDLRKAKDKALSEWNNRVGKDLIGAVREAKNFELMLKPVDGQVRPAQLALAATKLIRLSGDNRISDTDKEAMANPDPTIKAAAMRSISKKIAGRAITNDITFYRVIGKELSKAAMNNYVSEAEAFADQKSMADDRLDRDELATMFKLKFNIPHGSATENAAEQQQPSGPSWRKLKPVTE
jgi:hypothetical protein